MKTDLGITEIMNAIESTTPSQDALNLAVALECLRLMLETQALAMAIEEPLTPMQKLLAAWGIK
jgi:hypothetical protein